MDLPTSLSQDDARRRSQLLTVTSYDIEVDLTGLLEGDELRSRSAISFTAVEPGASTFVDCVADVVRAELNGSEIATPATGGRLTLPGLAADNTLVVEAVQRETGIRTGVHRSVDPADGRVYVWTSFEPDEARRVWACFDQPDLKAPHRFTVTAPSAWHVTGNTAPESVADLAGDARVWRFPATPPLSTYVPVVNAGPFHELRREMGGFDLGLLCRQSLRAFLDRDADELFDLTLAGLQFYGERFAMPFPQARYDQIFVPDLGGAMENYGCVTWSDQFVFRHEPSYNERALRADVLLHEMAHMWFGDIVTMRWWDDLWLNEAFADWASTWASAAATDYTDAWATFLAGRKLTGYAADRAPTTHPIRQATPDVATAAAGFDMITYAKGASVLKQLVAALGEQTFVAGLRAYFAKHAWSNASLDDLMGALSGASGRDLGEWVAGWLDRAGTDVVTARSSAGSLRLELAGPDGDRPRPHHLGVGVYAATDGPTMKRREHVLVDISDDPVELPLSLDGEDIVLLNDEDLTFATVLPDEAAASALLESAARLPTALARTLAVTTAWGMLVEGRLATERFVHCATSVLARETASSVVEPLLDLAVEAARLWTPEAERDAAMALVADTCVSIARREPALEVAAVRALASTAMTDVQLAALDELAVDIDLRWRALRRRAALGMLDLAEIEETLSADPDPDAWVQALLVRASAPTPEAKAEGWQAAMDGRIPLGMVGSLGRALWQPGQEAVLASYGDRYLDALRPFSRYGMVQAYAIVASLLPVIGVGRDFLDRIDAAAADDRLSPIVRRTMRSRADELRRMLVARGF
ncbi:MAG TPA: aminopeptidase N [Mycobacteriales bacterium]|nr:aminopeptidase N [Mycobacteriales bacterium]